MSFVEQRYLWFFLLAFLVHWGLGSLRMRKLWLLACSYAFYSAWNWKFLGLILLSTLIDYSVGRMLGRTQGEPHGADGQAVERVVRRRRKRWLLVSICANLGFLGFFKYYNFFAESGAEFLTWLGFYPSELTLRIILPVGISFYTFQTMSYTIDVYRRRLNPVRDYWDFSLFVAFFPQLVAGPIVRAVDFLPQLNENRDYRRHVALRASLTLLLIGFVKKACLADNVAKWVVDPVFADPEAYSTISNWLALAMYHIQVYGDFSGYSDMAIGSAGLLGYRLTENFDFPYFSPSIGEFWRRWHISLGTWLKDYLYVPLGGSWCAWPKRLRNIFVTMILCGLWHGAGWQYVAFGALHAVYVTVNRFWKHAVVPGGPLAFSTRYGAHLLTTFCLFLGWTIFRSESFANTLDMLKIFLFLGPGGTQVVAHQAEWIGLFFGAALVHFLCYRGWLRQVWTRIPDWSFSLAYGAAWALALPWPPEGHQPFIYFQF